MRFTASARPGFWLRFFCFMVCILLDVSKVLVGFNRRIGNGGCRRCEGSAVGILCCGIDECSARRHTGAHSANFEVESLLLCCFGFYGLFLVFYVM
jgi:hypothetical protein